MTTPAIIAGVLLVLLLIVGAVLLVQMQGGDNLAARIQEVQRRAYMQPDLPPAEEGDPAAGVLRPVAAVGAFVARSGLLSLRTLTELQQTLHTAGLRGQSGLSLFVGAKLMLFTGLPLVAYLFMAQTGWWPSYWMFVVMAGAVLGLLGPDAVVRSKRKKYLAALDLGLPDALDMLVICSEAGLGLEAAFERVGQEISHGHPVMSGEMAMTVQEMRINSDRRLALISLGERTGLDSLKRLGSTLVQTMQYGTPLASALRTLSVEMRQELLTRFEERAARLPVLLTMPMIMFILPCVFLVVGGPAYVKLTTQNSAKK